MVKIPEAMGSHGIFDVESSMLPQGFCHDWLVVEPTPVKNLKVNWDDELPNIWKIKKWSKPPTR